MSLGKSVAELVGESGMDVPKVASAPLLSRGHRRWRSPKTGSSHEAIEAVPDMDFEGSADDRRDARRPSPAAVTRTDSGARDRRTIDELRNEIMEAYLRYRKQDSFDLLRHCRRTPRRDQMSKKVYVAYSEKYAPWKFNRPGLDQALSEKAMRPLFIAGGTRVRRAL